VSPSPKMACSAERDAEKFGKKLFRDNDIEAVLYRLDRLTPDETRAAAAQTLEIVYGLSLNLRQVMSGERIFVRPVANALLSTYLLRWKCVYRQHTEGSRSVFIRRGKPVCFLTED